MSITLVTGLPGSGKTALIVDWLAHGTEFQNRPLFVMGVPELKIDHQPTPPIDEWTELRQSPEDPTLMLPYFTFPPNSVVWLDEGQRVYRPRGVSAKVPPEVAAFETHRHGGIDFIISTQHPNLLDSNLRRLVDKHVHVHVQPFGRELLEWTGGVRDHESRAERVLARRSWYKPPKRVFDLYKSAEVHTKIRRPLPKFVYLFAVAAVALLLLVWQVIHRVRDRNDEAQQAKAEAQVKPRQDKTVTGDANVSGQTGDRRSLPEYLAEREPRLAGIPFSAPLYDNVTAPREAPYPVGCVQSRARCKCIDQQGNTYPTTVDLCRSFVADGMFVPFKPAPVVQPEQAGAGVSSHVAHSRTGDA